MCTWLCAQMLAVLLASIRHASMLPHAETSLASVQARMLLVRIVDPISPRCVFRDLERGDMTAAVRKRRWQIHTPNWHFMKLIHWACEPQFVLAVKRYCNGIGYSLFLAHCQYDMMVRCIDWAIFYFWRLEVVVYRLWSMTQGFYRVTTCKADDIQTIKSADFIRRQKSAIFVCHTTDFIARFYRPILSVINLAVELGSNFAEKIGR